MPKKYLLNIDRQTDERLRLRMIMSRQGITITIKCTDQVGKGALMQYLRHIAEQADKSFAWLDCDQMCIKSENFFYDFCNDLTSQLGLEDRQEQKRPLINATRCTSFVRREILLQSVKPCVIAFSVNLGNSALLSMLRAWHNYRASKQGWRRLDIVVITSTSVLACEGSRSLIGEIIDLSSIR